MGTYQRPLRPDELMHFGIMGMKWGVRRYQNPDGTLTQLGKARQHKEQEKNFNTINKTDRFYMGSSYQKTTDSDYRNLSVASKAYKSKDVKDSAKDVRNSFIAKSSRDYDAAGWSNMKRGAEYLNDNKMDYSDEAADAIGSLIYCASKGKDARKEYDDYWNKVGKYNASCKNATKELLGKYGDKKLENFNSVTAKEMVNNTLKYGFGKELYGGTNLSNDLYEYYGYMQGLEIYGSDKDVYDWYNKKYGNKKR